MGKSEVTEITEGIQRELLANWPANILWQDILFQHVRICQVLFSSLFLHIVFLAELSLNLFAVAATGSIGQTAKSTKAE